MDTINVNNIELKRIILHEFATSLVDINIYGLKDQYPISTNLVIPNLIPFKKDIFEVIERNINTYHEVMLSQILQLLSYRELQTPKELFNLVLDKLIERRKDPTLKNTLDLNYPKEIGLDEIKLNGFKQYLLWAELGTDINYPIFRGFGFNVYTIEDKLYKEYYLPSGKFIYSCRLHEKPIYFMNGQNRKPGFLTDYWFYGTAPILPKFPKFIDDTDKIKYSIDRLLSILGINLEVDRSEIILDVDKPEDKINYTDLTDEERTAQIEIEYSSLKEICGI